MCRSVQSATGGPAQWPDASRLDEAICVRLCELHLSPTKSTKSKTGTVREQRWSTILVKYSHLREQVLSNCQLLDNTSLQLFELNQCTLTQWFVASPHSLLSSSNHFSAVQLHLHCAHVVPLTAGTVICRQSWRRCVCLFYVFSLCVLHHQPNSFTITVCQAMSIKLVAKLMFRLCVGVSGTTAKHGHWKIWSCSRVWISQWWRCPVMSRCHHPGLSWMNHWLWEAISTATACHQTPPVKQLDCNVGARRQTLFGNHWLRRLTYPPILASLALLCWRHQSLFLSQSRPLTCL